MIEKQEFLHSLIKDYKVGVEVGTCKGELAKDILSIWKGKLYLVDSWRYIPGLVDFNNPDHNGHLDNMAHAFMSVYEFGDRACIIRDTSVAAADLFKDASLDFVYLDAGHDKKSIEEDLEHWYPKVRVGGVIIGDDYFDGVFHLENIVGSTTVVEVKSTVDAFAAAKNKKVHSSETDHSSVTGKPSGIVLSQWWIKV